MINNTINNQMPRETRILLVDDEPDILEFLSYNLSKEGYEIKTAKSGKKALKIVNSWIPELIIMDLMMPEMDGMELCELIRKDVNLNKTLIVFLTARSESFIEISVLDSGADDYITKPIKPNLLKSKIKAVLRRHITTQSKALPNQNLLVFGDLVLNREEFKVTVGDNDMNLAKKEFELLSLLTSKPGKVFKREEILRKVWGREVIVGDRTIDVHIRKLREKIGKSYIKTLKGVGYKFKY